MTTPRLAALIALCGGLALTAAPSAQAQQVVDGSRPVELRPVDPQATLVEELIVNAPSPGPAWWKVSDADTTVYVLGVPALTPSKLDVDETVIRRRINGANVLIMGQEADISVVRLISLVMSGRRFFLSETPMRQSLPPDLRARLEARLAAMKDDLDSMDDVKPAFAGFVVANTDGGGLQISLGGMPDSIREIAKGRDVQKRPRVQNLRGYSVVDAIKTLGSAPQPLQELCLDAGLRQAESGQGGIKRLSERWARGEVREVLSADRGFARCLAATPDIARALRAGQTEAARAITAALKRPGKAVAVIELRSLLAEGGILDQLRTQGFKVETPIS